MLLSFVLFLFFATAQPQQDPVAYWDAVLEQYEQLGEASLKNESPKVINKLKKNLEEMLKTPVGKMNEEQRRRFQAIKFKHAGVELPEAPAGRVDTLVIIQQVPVERIREVERVVVMDTVKHIENIGKIQVENIFSRRDTTVVMHVHQPTAASPPVSLKSPARQSVPKQKKSGDIIFYAGIAGSVFPDFSIGGTIGIGTQKIGGYIKGRSNFNDIQPEYEFDSTGKIRQGEYFWCDGTASISRDLITAGIYFPIAGKFSAYAGAGLGDHKYLYRDLSGRWAELKDRRSSGLSLDLGIGYNPGSFRLFAGVNSTSFSYLDVEIGVALVIVKK